MKGGYLSQIPWKLLTDELLLVRNDDDVTPRRTAVRRGFIEQLPEHLRPELEGPLKRACNRPGFSWPRFWWDPAFPSRCAKRRRFVPFRP